jgi:hypothetical protein
MMTNNQAVPVPAALLRHLAALRRRRLASLLLCCFSAPQPRCPASPLLLACLLLTAGCARNSAQPTPEADDVNQVQMALEVENHNWSDINIYLMTGNHPYRLGMVRAASTAHFAFPYARLTTSGNSRLRAYPVGGPRTVTSENLLVQPGQRIKWTLETDLRRSFLIVQ